VVVVLRAVADGKMVNTELVKPNRLNFEADKTKSLQIKDLEAFEQSGSVSDQLYSSPR